MEAIHRVLAYLAIAAVLIGLAWALLVLAHRLPANDRFVRYQTVVVVLLGATAVVGAIQFLLLKATPNDGLHVVYGAVAVLLIPLGRSFLGVSQRRDAIVWTTLFLVLGGVMYRLVATG